MNIKDKIYAETFERAEETHHALADNVFWEVRKLSFTFIMGHEYNGTVPSELNRVLKNVKHDK